MTDDLMRQIGLEIQRSGVSYRRLADRTGLSTVTIWRIANGKREGSRSTTLTKIAIALGKRIDVNENRLVDTAETVAAKFAGVRHAMRMARWQ